MAVLSSPSELFEALGRDPQELIGQPETEWLDFKKEPYHLDDERHKFELAKDVSAIANAGRGVIAIGVETEKDEDSHQEVASELRPVGKGIVDPKRMQDTIQDWVYPRLDTEIRPHPVPNAEGDLWTVLVERQQEGDLPFIVAREFAGDRGADRNLFGMYKRHSSDNRPYPPSQVWRWLHDGWADRSRREPVSDRPGAVQADEILEDDLNVLALPEDNAFYSLQARPLEAITLPHFYPGAGGTSSVFDVLTRIPAIRPAGFNLPEGDPQRTTWNGLRVVWPQHNLISISRGGTCTAVLGQTYLTWGAERFAREGGVWINPLALVEYTLEFWRFYCSQVLERSQQIVRTEWRAGMRRLVSPPCRVYLPRGPLRRILGGGRASPAVEDDFDLPWKMTDDTEPGRLAFAALTEVYAKFGLGESLIPWVEEGQVSEDKIRSVDGG